MGWVPVEVEWAGEGEESGAEGVEAAAAGVGAGGSGVAGVSAGAGCRGVWGRAVERTAGAGAGAGVGRTRRGAAPPKRSNSAVSGFGFAAALRGGRAPSGVGESGSGGRDMEKGKAVF